ncbi:hypothetical protein JCM10213v2_007329 [Rhodosporidiobolus nylandii]
MGDIALTPEFEQYLLHATKAAEIARDACLATKPLRDRIQQLESELQVWKLGHQEATSQAKAAQKQLDAGDNIVYCVLDGDGCLPFRSFVQQGRDGGREWAKMLVKKVTEFAELQGVDGQLTVVVQIMLNKYGLSKVYNSCSIADDTTFSNFLAGLNAAHSLISVIDVGAQKEAADAKINASIRLYSKLQACKLVLAGCTHDGGYAHLFSSLETDSPAQFAKLTLVKSYAEPAFEIKRLALRSVAFEGLFEQKKLVSWSQVGPPQTPGRKKSPSPAAALERAASGAATPVAATPGPATSGYKTPKTVKKSAVKVAEYNKENIAAAPTPTKRVILRPIDPKKPLSKQSPPCCNQHYLAPPCLNGATCKYAHDYLLNPTQLLTLRKDAKKSPCVYALKNKPCKNDCFAGHFCPFKETCRYGLTCRFNQPGMHPPGTKGRTDGWAWKGEHIGGRVLPHAQLGSATESDDSGFETTTSSD